METGICGLPRIWKKLDTPQWATRQSSRKNANNIWTKIFHRAKATHIFHRMQDFFFEHGIMTHLQGECNIPGMVSSD